MSVPRPQSGEDVQKSNHILGLPRCSAVKNPPANAGDTGDVGSVPGLGSSPGGGHGDPLHYSCLENPWTKEPGRLQSMMSQRVEQDWASLYNNHVLEISTFCSLTARNSAALTLLLTKSSISHLNLNPEREQFVFHPYYYWLQQPVPQFPHWLAFFFYLDTIERERERECVCVCIHVYVCLMTFPPQVLIIVLKEYAVLLSSFVLPIIIHQLI